MASSPAFREMVVRLMNERQLPQAQAALQRQLQKDPGDAYLNSLMGVVLMQIPGNHERAWYYAQRACELAPEIVNYAHNLANVAMVCGKHAEAEKAFRRVLEKYPDRVDAIEPLAVNLLGRGLSVEVAELARRGLAVQPTSATLLSILATARENAGASNEAWEILTRAIALHPNNEGVTRLMALRANAHPGLDPEETARLHRRLGAILRAAVGEPLPPVRGREEGPLRVAVLSADLRRHSVAYFFEPLLVGLSGPKYEFFAFYANAVEDDLSARLKKHFRQWTCTLGMSYREVAAKIRAAKIDIVLDLTGLTSGEQLDVLALRPAPVQITYLGYPNTTGLHEVDFRIVDAITDPPGTEGRCEEKLLRLDGCFMCYTPSLQQLPEPAVRAEGPVTFCSFNALRKLNEPTVQLWARVLKENPGTRLLLKSGGLAEQGVRDEVAAKFVTAGVEPGRVELVGWVPENPMRVYERVDVGLDTFPYNGATTTCEAMWMGVPVVTLEGSTHAGRVGTTLLTHAGLPDLIARSPDEYVRIATLLANDRPRRDALRTSLRDRMRSTIADQASFVRRFEKALDEAWAQRRR